MSYEFGNKVNVKSENISSENITQKLFEVNSRIKQNIIINSKNADSWMSDLNEAQEEGNIFHHPPTAGHRMLTTENPLLAIWIWTGAIHGRYWFVGHEEIDCQLK